MTIKLRAVIKHPARVEGENAIAVEKENGVYRYSLDLSALLGTAAIPDQSTSHLLLFTPGASDNDPDIYQLISVADFNTVADGAVQIITAGGAQHIDAGASLVIVNQAVGAPITLTLPLASAKAGAVKVVDWKGDAGTNNITVVPSGTETFNGAGASWVIGGGAASAVFTPYSGAGYAV